MLHNSEGKVLWALAEFYNVQINMVAEARALLGGLRRCVLEGRACIDIEVDLLILKQVIQKKHPTPWSIAYEIREIFFLLDRMEFQVLHIYRESNYAADFLANWGCKEQLDSLFEEYRNFPRILKGIVRVDKSGIPNIGCKKF